MLLAFHSVSSVLFRDKRRSIKEHVAASYAHLASRGVSRNPDFFVIRKIKKKTFIPELEITT